MLRISKTTINQANRSSRKIVQLKPYTPPPENPENKLFSENKDLGRHTELNQVSRTKFKIEKRTTWPRTYPVRIFNDDGSSYIINMDKPHHLIKFPYDVVKTTADPAAYVRRVFMKRLGKRDEDFVKLDFGNEQDK